jgi:hypothetical protein
MSITAEQFSAKDNSVQELNFASLDANVICYKFSENYLGNFEPMSHTQAVHRVYFPVLTEAGKSRDFTLKIFFREIREVY